MTTAVRKADKKGRVALPGFANATVIIETVNESEYRVRKARVIPEEDLQFPEDEVPIVLTEREGRQILEMIENPPKPNAALKRAFKRYRKNHG
jgi:hypothetical protein